MAKKKEIEENIGVGRRKTAVSSVRVRPGTGKVNINGREGLDKYFTSLHQIETVLSPLIKFSSPEKYDLIIRVKGGGPVAQATATRLGISRALVKEDETLRGGLKEQGFLTRDPRMKERKKYGRRGARRGFQFSKR